MSDGSSLQPVLPAEPLAPGVGALFTTRAGGTSAGPWGLVDGAAGGLNLGDHVGDDPAAVAANRARLAALLPAAPRWLRQVHGTVVADFDDGSQADDAFPEADAAVTTRAGVVLAVLSADCLPVLLADRGGRVVGAAHAGWRGLAAGVLEATADRMRARVPAADLMAWIGPSIGPAAFEVGDEVRAAFVDRAGEGAGADVIRTAFVPAGRPGKWLADLPSIARVRLAAAGVATVAADVPCTLSDPGRFWSYRRDGACGRIAGCVWLHGGFVPI